MNKIGVVGDRDSVLGFKAIGLDMFPVSGDDEASAIINKCAREGYAVLFITEQAAEGISDTLDKYKFTPYPAIILIPGNRGTLGIGMRQLHENVEKAIGADILSEKEGR